MKTVFRFLTVFVLVATTLLVGCNTATPDELKVVGEVLISEKEHYPGLASYGLLDPPDSIRIFIKGYYKEDNAHLIYDVVSKPFSVEANPEYGIEAASYPSMSFIDTVVVKVVNINKWLPEIYKVNERKSKLAENERYFRYALMDLAMYSYYFKLSYNPYTDEAIVDLISRKDVLTRHGLEDQITRIEYTGDLDNKIKQLFEVHPILVLNFYLSNNVEQHYANPEVLEVIIWAAGNRDLLNPEEFKLYSDVTDRISSGRYGKAADILYSRVTFVENKDRIDLLLDGKKISYIPMDVFDY
jgi:hypothetical protein